MAEKDVMARAVLAKATAAQDDLEAPPRAVLLFAHPDDETIALGARLGRFQNALLVHVTDGIRADGADAIAHGFATIPEYRTARWQELDQALRVAGVGGMRRERFDIPDQEACLQLSGLTRRLTEILCVFRPDAIFTHPYEGGHPDHDACAFAVHHAALLLESRGEPVPVLIEAAFYHAGPLGCETGRFLAAEPAPPECIYPLSLREQERKQALFDCFVTRRETLGLFNIEEERFRIAPAYDFRRRPHLGDAYYDSSPWGMTSQQFCELAVEAEAALQEEMKSACC